jgi:cytosine/adenosine deaminase-related metal-dependent hydrolase
LAKVTGQLLTARWVFPISSPPIADGAVAIQGGRIVGVGARAELTAAHAAARRWDLGAAALLPGLVNCHTHLELSLLPPPGGNGTFAEWLVALIERRRQLDLAVQAAAALAGAHTLLESGTTCVGEVSTTGQSLAVLRCLGLRGVVYREILGLAPGEAQERWDAVQADLRTMQEAVRGTLLRVGLSPHSPYSLSEELFGACGAVLEGACMPCCIHAAESPEEVEFLAAGEGAIPRLLYPAVGCRVPPPRRRAQSPIEYLDGLGVLGWHPLLIHAVHVNAADIRRMAEAGAGVAHCPRSNARLSGGVAPVPAFLARGIAVGLGTDSLASAPTLDLWDEMRAALAVHAGRLTPAAVLEMATLGGAKALGLAGQVGSLEVGKRADLIAVAAGAVAASDPTGSLIARTRGSNVWLTLVEGEIRHHRLEAVPCA